MQKIECGSAADSVSLGSGGRLAEQSLSGRPIATSPVTNLPLSRVVQVQGESFQFGSDWHLPRDPHVLGRVAREILSAKGADTFLCLGDVFDADDGADTSSWTNQFLNLLSDHFERVLYVPGNHCLRGRTDPWGSFSLPDNVVMPKGSEPLVVSTANNKILLGNAFFDLNFIDPLAIGITEIELRKFYQEELTDSRSLLGGGDHFQLFKEMSAAIAGQLTPDISILLTHVLPHPAGVTFRVPEITDRHRQLSTSLGVPFECDPDGDQRNARKYSSTPEEFRRYWNCKSFFMGSNLLLGAQCRSDLVAIYGHNHRGSQMSVALPSGASVNLMTHQPYGGSDTSAWNLI